MSRIEKDALGTLELPEDCLYGIHTQRSLNHFSYSDERLDPVFIKAFALVKKACILANEETGYLDTDKARVLAESCMEIAEGKHHEWIVVNPWQGGAGTSTNMNFNEVIANLALKKLDFPPGSYDKVHPLQDVNRHQSTNDVYPTALRVAVLLRLKDLEKVVKDWQADLQEKESIFQNVLKLGRTELQDAVPMTLGMTFGAWAEAVARDRWRIFKARERIKIHNLGGTAVGTGLGAPRDYIFKASEYLKKETGLTVARAENLVDATQNLDNFVEVSAILKSYAVNLIKIANDLRLLSSGPSGGYNELCLPEIQAGSSIMPGKVNPVIPESAVQIALRVISNDQVIALAAGMGQLELNHLLPLISHTFMESLKLLTSVTESMNLHCTRDIQANRESCESKIGEGWTLATALVPYFGYDTVQKWVKEALSEKKSFKKLVLEKKYLTQEQLNTLLSPQNMLKLGFTPGDNL
jgi:aspartate ammonia-lyase